MGRVYDEGWWGQVAPGLVVEGVVGEQGMRRCGGCGEGEEERQEDDRHQACCEGRHWLLVNNNERSSRNVFDNWRTSE